MERCRHNASYFTTVYIAVKRYFPFQSLNLLRLYHINKAPLCKTFSLWIYLHFASFTHFSSTTDIPQHCSISETKLYWCFDPVLILKCSSVFLFGFCYMLLPLDSGGRETRSALIQVPEDYSRVGVFRAANQTAILWEALQKFYSCLWETVLVDVFQ